MDSSVLAGSERCGVYEAASRSTSQAFKFEKEHQWNSHLCLKLNEAVKGHQVWKKVFHMNVEVVVVIAFEVCKVPIMEHNQNAHDLGISK